MNRDQIREQVLSAKSKNILCELPTSFGKSKIALDRMAKVVEPKLGTKILVVVPRLLLMDNWREEFKKWGYDEYLNFTDFVTYVSFPKKANIWDMVIFDEAHHLSDRCKEALEDFRISNSILLSATVSRDMEYELPRLFPSLCTIKVSTKSAIQNEVLPDPKVFLIPLHLDNKIPNCEIVKNKSQKTEIRIPFERKFDYAKVKNKRVVITCTQQQCYDDMTAMINWYKKKMFSEIFKNKFLKASGDRLKWLSEQKTEYVRRLLCSILKDQRTLTFCNGIPQTEVLGKYCINSKNKASSENLEKFNAGKVDHITACNMLDEGMNLANCRVGVYAVLNSSERMITQKLGRLLRHKNPVLIIPYFVGTREEELVQKMLEDYNPELVKTITNLSQLTL